MKKLWLKLGNIVFWLAWPALWFYMRIGTRTRLLLICDDEFLVLKGWLGSGNWMLPGGGLHRHEDPLAGLMREVLEETGIRLQKDAIRLAYKSKSSQYGLSFTYSCFTIELTQKPIISMQRGEIVGYDWQPVKTPTLPLSNDTVQALDWWKNKG